MTRSTGKVVAAIDNSAASRRVLETASRLGALLDAPVEALHVIDDGDRTATGIADWAGVDLRVVAGPVGTALLEADSAPDVLAIVIGARSSPFGPPPVGHVTRELMERGTRPLVVVPLDGAAISRPIRRIVVALEDTGTPTFTEGLDLFDNLRTETEIIAVHVFGEATIPMFLDHPQGLEVLGRELLEREQLTSDARTVWRTGPAHSGVVEAARAEDADLLVLAWGQDFAAGHAAVVHEALVRADLPVLLLARTRPRTDTIELRAKDDPIDLATEEQHDRATRSDADANER
jgi:Universal stress protein family